ncbi:ABC transporter permease [Archaeoglobales archaeon]|nr:MAG: ABC transporter permease [Archaeoglobales archaeon]
MVSLLNLKVFRDIKAKKGMFFAVTFIVFLGVMLFSSFYTSYLNIKETYNTFYEESEFEDASITVVSAPSGVIKEIKKIDGVLEAEGRLKVKASMKAEQSEIRLYLISLPEKPKINKLYFVEGGYFPKNSRSVLLLKKFADYHGISVGDFVKVRVNGRDLNLRVSGLVYSPEFIWIVEEGEYFTTPRTLGVAFVPEQTLKEIFGDRINEVKVRVQSYADSEEVLSRCLYKLKGYNILNFYTGENQPSKKLLQLDLEGFKQLAFLFPSFFLLISIFAVYVLQTRLVKEQIGYMAVMMALGISRREVLLHYLKHPLVIAILAGTAGNAAGYAIAVVLTKEYTAILNLPNSIAKPHYDIIAAGFLASFTPVISGFLVARSASKLEIAHVMRGIIETKEESIFEKYLERFLKVSTRASMLTKFSIRNLFRNKKRTAYSIFSVVASLMLIMVSMVFVDAVDFTMDLTFNKALNYDLDVRLAGYQSQDFLEDVRKIKGVSEAYPILSGYFLIEKGGETKAISLMGMPNQDLYRVFDGEGRVHLMPPKGILFPQSMAKNLGIVKGEKISILTEKGKKSVLVYDVVEIVLSPAAFASLEELQRMLRIDGFNQVIISVEKSELERVKSKLEDDERVLRVDTIEGYKEDMMQLMGFFYVFIFFSLLFGASLGFASIFNTTTVNLLERSREIATLRMIGYTAKEVSITLFIENMIIGLMGIVAGLPLAYGLAKLYFLSFESELYHLPLVIYPRTYVITVVLVFVVLAVSLIPGIRYIKRMEIDRITKEFIS